MSKNENIVVTGLGVISPYGNTFSEFWRGITSGKSNLQTVTNFQEAKWTNPKAVQIDLPSGYDVPLERILYLGVQAAKNALENWQGDLNSYEKIGFIVGSGLGLADQLNPKYADYQNGDFLSQLGNLVASQLGLNADVIYLSNACSAGSQAISFGMDLLALDEYDLVIAGGLDILSQVAYAGFLRLNSIDHDGCRPFDLDRKGIMVGEGAAFFVLEKAATAVKNNHEIHCNLAAASTTHDAFHIVQIKPDCKEIFRALDAALDDAKLAKDSVDLIVAHGTGTIINDKVEAYLINNYFGDQAEYIHITAPKSAMGHTGGASGAFSLLVSIGALQTGIIPPVINLKNIDPQCNLPLIATECKSARIDVAVINTFAFGGTNVILICQNWESKN